MPTFLRDDGVPMVTFDPGVEISPFTLFKRLRAGHPVELVDVRPEPGRRTLRGAIFYPGDAWEPSDPAAQVVLFDDDGIAALEVARRLQTAGFERARALFGGLDLYEFSLDPEIVGTDTYLTTEV